MSLGFSFTLSGTRPMPFRWDITASGDDASSSPVRLSPARFFAFHR